MLDEKNKLVVVTPRQMGFTSLIAARRLWELQIKQNAELVVVVPGHHQSKYFMDYINRWILKGQLFNMNTSTRTYFSHNGRNVLKFNNNTLRSIPYNNNKHIIGNKIDTLFLLDYAFYGYDKNGLTLETCMKELASDGKIVIISTPAPGFHGSQATKFKNLYYNAVDKKNDFYPYRVVWQARNDNTIKDFVKIVDAFGVTQFNYELLATFE